MSIQYKSHWSFYALTVHCLKRKSRKWLSWLQFCGCNENILTKKNTVYRREALFSSQRWVILLLRHVKTTGTLWFFLFVFVDGDGFGGAFLLAGGVVLGGFFVFFFF